MTVKFQYHALGDDGIWYRVKDANDVEYAVFSLIDAPKTAPRTCKHMNINILPHIAEEIVENGNVGLLLRVYTFVFNAVLEITHELRGVKLCKIYSDNELTAMVYKKFASNLSTKFEYEVKFYGRWIEIKKPRKHK